MLANLKRAIVIVYIRRAITTAALKEQEARQKIHARKIADLFGPIDPSQGFWRQILHMRLRFLQRPTQNALV
jgi:hypothetical protein